MPTYDFNCGNCGNTFEKRLRIDDRLQPETEPCPSCGSISVQLAILMSNGHTYGLGAEAKNNYGGFPDVLKRIADNTPGAKGLRDYIR